VELPPGAWVAPPIRTASPPAINKRKRFWSLVAIPVIVSIVLVIIGGVGLGGYLLYRNTESGQRALAEKEYADGKYAAAAMRYRNMSGGCRLQLLAPRSTASSPSWPTCSALRVGHRALPARRCNGRATQFLADNENNPLLQQHQQEVAQSCKLFGSLPNTVMGDERSATAS
jgi:hypothetical protein